MNKNTNKKIALISFPWPSNAPYKFISDILKILEPITDKILLITGNTQRINFPRNDKIKILDIKIGLHYTKDIKPEAYSKLLWITKSAIVQFKTGMEIINNRKDIDIVLFYVTYPYYIFPLIISKLLKKKTIEIVTRNKINNRFDKILSLQNHIFFSLLDGISLESNLLIKELHLSRYKKKLLGEGSRYIDISRYKIKKRLNSRANKVGFIGRLVAEKGVAEFIKAIPIIKKEREDVEFFIGGSGNLDSWIKKECDKLKGDNTNIILTGWIGDEMPDYLNDLKLLVLPTYSDSLPTIILEGMSCGTPILASYVGAIPSLIKDGDTGFILKTNSPECIAKNVINILESDCESIVANARQLIVEKYTYDAAVHRFRDILFLKSNRSGRKKN